MKNYLDIDKIMPDIKGFILTDKKEKKYRVDLFIPVAASLVGEKCDNDHDATMMTIEIVLKAQYDYMDRKWIEENISLPIINNTYLLILNTINQGQKSVLDEMGMMDETLKKKTISGRFWRR